MLFAQCCGKLGQIELAKAALRKAAQYAKVYREYELLDRAALDLSRLERATGNHRAADQVLDEYCAYKTPYLKLEQLEIAVRRKKEAEKEVGRAFYQWIACPDFTPEILKNASPQLREVAWQQLFLNLGKLQDKIICLPDSELCCEFLRFRFHNLMRIERIVAIDPQAIINTVNMLVWAMRVAASAKHSHLLDSHEAPGVRRLIEALYRVNVLIQQRLTFHEKCSYYFFNAG